MKIKKLAIGGDHAGYQLKSKLKEVLIQGGVEVIDFGPDSEESCDYADYAHPLADSVASKQVDAGILICGSGNGIAMAANKHQEIRAAICWEKELAILARQHNDANILVLPARFIADSAAIDCMKAFISEKFEGGRHLRRIEKIPVK
jgi:ribose 5-phosphate isomerase B